MRTCGQTMLDYIHHPSYLAITLSLSNLRTRGGTILDHIHYPTSHKKFSEGKQAHVGMESSKTNQTRMGMTPQHLHTIPTSCAILLPLTQICFVFVSCVQRRVFRGSGVGSGGCVVHVDVHGE